MKVELQEQACSLMPTAIFRGVYLGSKRIIARKPLWQEAIDGCDLDLATNLILQYGDINARHKLRSYGPGNGAYEFTVLSYALHEFAYKPYDDKLLAMIKLLLDAGANPNLSDFYDGKPYETAFAGFVIHGLPDPCSKPGWTEAQWLNMVELLMDNGADPNAEYDTEDFRKGNSKWVQQPPIRTILVDLASQQPNYGVPRKFKGLVGLLANNEVDPNKIVNGKTALDYAFNQYFESFHEYEREHGKKWEPLWGENSIWVISELINAGANIIMDGRLSIGNDHTKRSVPEEFIHEIFKSRATECAYKQPAHALVRQILGIFDVSEERAHSLSAELIKSAEAQLLKRDSLSSVKKLKA